MPIAALLLCSWVAAIAMGVRRAIRDLKPLVRCWMRAVTQFPHLSVLVWPASPHDRSSLVGVFDLQPTQAEGKLRASAVRGAKDEHDTLAILQDGLLSAGAT